MPSSWGDPQWRGAQLPARGRPRQVAAGTPHLRPVSPCGPGVELRDGVVPHRTDQHAASAARNHWSVIRTGRSRCRRLRARPRAGGMKLASHATKPAVEPPVAVGEHVVHGEVEHMPRRSQPTAPPEPGAESLQQRGEYCHVHEYAEAAHQREVRKRTGSSGRRLVGEQHRVLPHTSSSSLLAPACRLRKV